MTSVSAGSGAGPAGSDPPVGADELRERLLRAAAAVFARQGYDGTKIMDIVRESGLSTGAVYGRFRSKNDLLREAIVSRSSSAARLGADGVERVADLIAAGVTSCTSRPLGDAEAQRDGTVSDDTDPEAVLFLVRILHLGLLLHRGSGLPGPDEAAWQALVGRIVASFGDAPAGSAPGDPLDRQREDQR